MQSKPPKSTRFGISIVGLIAAVSGGLAAAIMVAAASKHLAFDGKLQIIPAAPGRQLLPMMLACLSPLPLMVATVGFGTLSGAIAVLVGAAAFGAVSLYVTGDGALEHSALLIAGVRAAAFAFMFGAPALLLGGLARHSPEPPAPIDPVPNASRLRPEERSVGRVLAAAIAVAAILAATMAVLFLRTKGGYDAFLQDIVKQIEPILAADPNAKRVSAIWLARILLWITALTVSAEVVCLFALNLWLAGRIAQTSGLLAKPWPDLPRTLRVPTPLAIFAAIAFGLSFAGGLVGLVSIVVAGAIMAGFAFQGLAVIHQLTRGSAWRLSILFSIYLVLGFFPPLMLVFALAGLCDAAFFFRDRQSPIVEKKSGPRRPGPKDGPKNGPKSGPWS